MKSNRFLKKCPCYYILIIFSSQHILEYAIHSIIMNDLRTKSILSDAQSGCRKSSETQLITLINDLAKSLSNESHSDVAFLDFSKTLDEVNHRKLCQLEHFGIRGSLLKGIRNYLSKKTQVIVEGKMSISDMFKAP